MQCASPELDKKFSFSHIKKFKITISDMITHAKLLNMQRDDVTTTLHTLLHFEVFIFCILCNVSHTTVS